MCGGYGGIPSCDFAESRGHQCRDGIHREDAEPNLKSELGREHAEWHAVRHWDVNRRDLAKVAAFCFA